MDRSLGVGHKDATSRMRRRNTLGYLAICWNRPSGWVDEDLLKDSAGSTQRGSLFHLFFPFLGGVQTSSNSASLAVSGSIFSHFVGEVYLLYSSFIDK